MGSASSRTSSCSLPRRGTRGARGPSSASATARRCPFAPRSSTCRCSRQHSACGSTPTTRAAARRPAARAAKVVTTPPHVAVMRGAAALAGPCNPVGRPWLVLVAFCGGHQCHVRAAATLFTYLPPVCPHRSPPGCYAMPRAAAARWATPRSRRTSSARLHGSRPPRSPSESTAPMTWAVGCEAIWGSCGPLESWATRALGPRGTGRIGERGAGRGARSFVSPPRARAQKSIRYRTLFTKYQRRALKQRYFTV